MIKTMQKSSSPPQSNQSNRNNQKTTTTPTTANTNLDHSAPIPPAVQIKLSIPNYALSTVPKFATVSIPVDVPITLKLVENVSNMVPRKKLNCVKWMDVVIELGIKVFVEGMGLLMLHGVLLLVVVEIKNVVEIIIMIIMTILAATTAATVHQQKNENEEIAQQQIVLIKHTLEEYVVNMVQK
jgi:hypothetical protein